MISGPFEPAAGGVRVTVRVTPKASRNAVTGLADTAAGGRALKLSVTAVPEDGKANEAVVKLLAKLWKLPKSNIALVAGATDRNKILHVAGDPADLMRRLTAALPADPRGASAEGGVSYG